MAPERPHGRFLAGEAGDLVGVSGTTIGQWARRGYIRASRSTGDPHVYSLEDVAEAWVVHALLERGVGHAAVRRTIEALGDVLEAVDVRVARRPRRADVPAPRPLADRRARDADEVGGLAGEEAAVGTLERHSRRVRRGRLEGKGRSASVADAEQAVPVGLGHRRRLRGCLLYTSPSPRDKRQSRMPSSA